MKVIESIITACLFTLLMIFMFVMVFSLDNRSKRLAEQTRKAYAQCAAAGHSVRECDEYWITSGEYKRAGNTPSKEWIEFTTPKGDVNDKR